MMEFFKPLAIFAKGLDHRCLKGPKYASTALLNLLSVYLLRFKRETRYVILERVPYFPLISFMIHETRILRINFFNAEARGNLWN